MLRLVWLVAGFALLTGCARKLPEELKSPYQEALEAYYQGLDGPSLDGALEEVNAVIARHPGDLEARCLRAQIHLQRYRDDPGPGRRTQLAYDLRSLARALRAGGQAADWVLPRLYVTVGDLLLLDGYHLLRADSFDQGNPDFTFWKAYTHFLGARAYFAYTEALAAEADSASNGLIRERANAADGLVRALAGMVESTSLLDPAQQAPAIAARRAEALALLEQRMTGMRPPLEVPDRSMLTLEASDQNIAAGLYRIRSSEHRLALQRACSNPSDEGPKPEALWQLTLTDLERASFHYLMESLLTGREQSGYEQSIQLMDVVFRLDGGCS